MFVAFIQNLTLLVSAVVVYVFIIRRWEKGSITYTLFSGLLFGAVAVLGMMMPLVFEPGVIFDGRSIIHSIAGLFGGPLTALVAALVSSIYRISIGGGGVAVGVFTIVQSSAFGVAFHYLIKSRKVSLTALNLIFFSLIVHLIMLYSFTYIPGMTSVSVLNNLALPIILLYPLTTLVIASVISLQENRLNAEKELIENENRLKKTQEIAHVGSWDLDLLANKLSWSEEVYQIFGSDSSAFAPSYEAFLEYIHPDDRMKVDQAYSDSVDAGMDSYEIEHRVVRQDSGEIRAVLERCEHFKDGSGRIIRSIGMIQDITERKQAEEALERLAQHWQTTFDATNNAIWVLDGEQQILQSNKTAESFFKKARQEMIGRYCCEIVHGTSEPISGCPFLRMKKSLHRESMELQVGDRWFEVTVDPIITEEGSLTGAVHIVSEITESKRLHIQLQELNNELELKVEQRTINLEALNKELASFAYSISHDFRAPLRALDAFSANLNEKYGDQLDEKGRHYLSRIRNAALYMSDLIDSLLKLSRITRAEINPQDLDLSRLAEERIQLLRETEPQRRVAVKITPGLTARGDRALLRAALDNLLENVWKFSANEAQAEVEVGRTTIDGEEVFFVRDNGVGFNIAYADNLFGAFKRLHAVDEFPGTGIGLATVQRIINRHGGQIWAEAEEGKGATFYFTLPGK